MSSPAPALLVLEDGRHFRGFRFGGMGEVTGEVVFNTAMTGYQEILGDPSYAGQIVVMTYPMIGNYGIAPEDYENLFLPYFSTKNKGTGLGLVIVRQIISEHNGFVRAEPNQPQGTRLIIELPVS